MPTHAAFLRGMNLGKRRITNDELCACFEDLGFTEVAAFLASGNVVFAAGSGDHDPARLARRIAEGLEAALAYPVPTFLRTADEVRALAEHEPFPAGEIESSEGKLQVALLAERPAKADREAALALATGDDRLALGERELWWLPAGRMSDSELDLRALEKLVGDWTMRTANTIRRMRQKFF